MRYVLLQIVGFLLFAAGKLLTPAGLGSTMDFTDKGLYLNVFTNYCYFFLAIYCYTSSRQCTSSISTKTSTFFMWCVVQPWTHLIRKHCSNEPRCCRVSLWRRKEGSGSLGSSSLSPHADILADPPLPRLLHVPGKNFRPLSQEAAVPASASTMIILAEFSRVFFISDTSNKLAKNNDVV